jgi:hypothetical protein
LAAEQSANIARDTLTASRRPWIQSSIVATEGRFRVDGAFDATFRFTFKNTGLDPAFNVMPQFRVVSGRVPNVPIDEHRRFCDEQRNIPANKHNGGYTIFPGEERAITITGPPLSHSAIETELAPERARAMEQHRPPIDVIMPVLIGCVQYQVGTNPEWHQTRFVYGILQGLEVDAAFTGMVRVPNGDGERIVGDLKLAPLAFDLGAFHAD